MKTFKGRKQETLLLIEESDLDDKIASKLRGNHVDYIIAPLSAKDNEDFMKQALCCISISGIYWGGSNIILHMNELLSILKGHTSIEEALEFYQLIYRAVKENAYIHPGWDYLRYPSVTIKSIE